MSEETLDNLIKILVDECSRRCVLEKKLKIAVDFLKQLSGLSVMDQDESMSQFLSDEALQKIEEVK